MYRVSIYRPVDQDRVVRKSGPQVQMENTSLMVYKVYRPVVPRPLAVTVIHVRYIFPLHISVTHFRYNSNL